MMNVQLWKYVRGVMWDYEHIPESVEFVERDDLLMYKTEGSSSILSNKVAKFEAESTEEVAALLDEVLQFYDGKPFSWWIGPDSKPESLEELLLERGLTYEDTYYGLILPIKDDLKPKPIPYQVRVVETVEDVQHYVDVSAEVWGHDDATKEHLVKQRYGYLKTENKRGGFLIAMHGDKPVGYAGYRFSSDGVAMYLAGTGVLPEYRKQGIYHSLLTKRMELAAQNGSKYIVTQARKDNSEPILRKLGFEEIGSYEVYKKTNKADS
ncbi:GNAT family N-acetyltransferase [Pseudalkalibacillus sp. Hm43]|uniref:GNAT family N-acetyltransferase n=1 Tax=Pseudalkalibacillus sp. Hm43 TaxID=3450742 RepID=UPI003F42E6D4